MKEVGGYFGLELHRGDNHYHDTPYVMKSGRSALLYIFTLINPDLVHIPYYTCDGLLEPFDHAGIKYKFYEINDVLDPKYSIDLKPGEYFLYVNYMDLKRETVSLLSEKYGDKLIVDCTQAFFMRGNSISWFFNSCRKFFGVPDGSYLYAPAGMELLLPGIRNEEYLVDHLLKRFNGHTRDGYEFFLKNEELAGRDMSRISLLGEYLLSLVNYKEVEEKRRENFIFLHDELKGINQLAIDPPGENIPMCYPLLLKKSIDKTKLFSRNIFIPSFWNDTLNRNIEGFDLEKRLSVNLLPLPVDHRYDTEDMQHIIQALTSIINA